MMGRDESLWRDRLGVSRETMDALAVYERLLKKWQARINLIGPATVDHIWTRHFLDSAQLIAHIRDHSTHQLPAHWLDFGVGAGFPGLVLALCGAGRIDLVESDRRKCSFLRQVILETGASAHVHTARIEALPPFPVDLITARALAPLDRLLDYAYAFATPQTEMWFLKGKEVQLELENCRKSWVFDAETFESWTDPQAMIVRLRTVSRA
ncbi:16S rRNA (guanine(527)-N(7))-methyltransferase RsmG [Iodidimonas gelatinilytica]|nr:16S rRNA (guanine(527)-N(7))-methyltransferase RsmG [Iodidimonas gelatinilytica]